MSLAPAIDQSVARKRRGGVATKLNPRGGLPPEVLTARLPEVYEEAIHALERCEQLDQCKGWADQYQALASYARQAKDERMRAYCDRVKARAVKRAGEILQQIPDNNRGRPVANIQEGTLPNITRSQAAADAGMSEHQRKTALRVAKVLGIHFEMQVESERPPTVTQLAEQGRVRKPDTDVRGPEFKLASDISGWLRRVADFCAKTDPLTAARLFDRDGVRIIRPYVKAIQQWITRFACALQDSGPPSAGRPYVVESMPAIAHSPGLQ
jgi:hypothetical protein